MSRTRFAYGPCGSPARRRRPARIATTDDDARPKGCRWRPLRIVDNLALQLRAAYKREDKLQQMQRAKVK
jgi:hypothetical protein